MLRISVQLVPGIRQEFKSPTVSQHFPPNHKMWGVCVFQNKARYMIYMCVCLHIYTYATHAYVKIPASMYTVLTHRPWTLSPAIPSLSRMAQYLPLSGSLLNSQIYSTPRPHCPTNPTSYKHSSKLNNTTRKQRDKSGEWDFLQDCCKNSTNQRHGK